MSKNVDEFELGETDQDMNNNKITIPDIFLEEFHKNITMERLKFLYNKLKLYEIKGFVTHDKYFESMKETFAESIKNKINKLYTENKIKNTYLNLGKNIDDCLNELFELYFKRFREVKCLIKNDKTVFYLTDYKPENNINTYKLICSLTVLMKSSFDNKIKLLFELTDIDEDGFLNEAEIRNMITTCNFLFCEESNHINTNSSILAQSLMTFKVNDILKQILYEQGNLYLVLEKERYINFNLLYKSIIKVKDYKYNVLPSFVNLKYCLKNIKKEKIIKVDDKFKKDFISVSSSLFSQKGIHANRELYTNSSTPNLGKILKPRKIQEENYKHNSTTNIELPNINKNFFYKRESVLRNTLPNFNNKNAKNNKLPETPNSPSQNIFSKTVFGALKNISSRNSKKSKTKLIIEKRKTLKDLLKETTIIDINNGKDKKAKTLKNFNRSSYYNKENTEAKYIFEAYFDKIKNIEVKPGVIKFVGGNIDKEKDKDKDKEKESSNSGSTRNLNNVVNNTNINNINNINNITNKSNRKISEEKNTNKYIKMFSFSEKSLLGSNKDFQNSIIKEEISSEEKDNDDYNKTKAKKKYKIINPQNKSNKSNNKTSIKTPIILKRDDKKNLTGFKLIPNPENVVKNRNYSFHKRASVFRRKIITVSNPKNAVKIQKSIMSTNLKNVNIYKTLDEVFKEINTQESKFNNDSYGGFGNNLLNIAKKIFEEQNELKKLLGFGDKKAKPISFGGGYLARFSRTSSDKNIISENEQRE